MIPKESVQVVLDAARIDEVVSDFVALKKRGANLLGICPFHNEKTPSFTVSVAKNIFKCFGCAKGGTPVDFIMEHESLSFPDAVRYLARKYNIELPETKEELSDEQRQQINEKESLYIVSAFAQKFFSDRLLASDEGQSIGLSYFTERGFTRQTVEKFQLGYAPEHRSEFTTAALEQGYALEFLVKAGLTIKTDDGRTYDRFAGRVIFPIHNITGRVIGFGGRTLRTDKKTAKYVNSPESEIYHKSDVLYGLSFARKSIAAADNCYLVEGYSDVISLSQSGIENVVASSGTSLTTGQIKLIKRYTNNITILYDGDEAGIKASFRGIDMILEEGMNVKVLLFPDGDDPDSYARKHNDNEVREYLQNNATDFIRFRLQLSLKDVQNDPLKRAGLIKEIVNSIALIPDGIVRSVYVKDCSRLLETPEEVLLNELNKVRRGKFQKEAQGQAMPDVPLIPVQQEAPRGEDQLSAELHEQEVLRLLLSYGKDPITVTLKDEKDNPVEVTDSVAWYILFTLFEEEQTEIENLFCAKILTEFYSLFCQGIIPGTEYFLHHEDNEVRRFAVDLSSSKYSLSNWGKKDVYVREKDIDIRREIRGQEMVDVTFVRPDIIVNTIYAFKMRKLEKKIAQNLEAMKHSPENIEELLQYHQQLLSYKVQLSAHLGRVIVK